jgi:hypothetical protein
MNINYIFNYFNLNNNSVINKSYLNITFKLYQNMFMVVAMHAGRQLATTIFM